METTAVPPLPYAARLEIDYPEKLHRLSSAFRLIWIIPIFIILALLAGSSYTTYFNQAGEVIRQTRDTSSGLMGGLFVATALMILFRQVYPRWWFDFIREFTRFSTRVGAYLFMLSDVYPSTVDEQYVHLDIDYPEVKTQLLRGMPLIKWFLAIPHYIILAFLAVGAVFVWIIAWFAILFTAKYPRGLFNYVVGVMRWGLRVNAYAFLLVTDRYPPFSLR